MYINEHNYVSVKYAHYFVQSFMHAYLIVSIICTLIPTQQAVGFEGLLYNPETQ